MHEMYLGHSFSYSRHSDPTSTYFLCPSQLYILFFWRKILFIVMIVIALSPTVPPLPFITFLSPLHGLCLLSPKSILGAACVTIQDHVLDPRQSATFQIYEENRVFLQHILSWFSLMQLLPDILHHATHTTLCTLPLTL